MSVLYFKNKYYPKVKCIPDFKQECAFNHKVGVAFLGKDAFFASGLNEGGNVHFVKIPSDFSGTLKNWVKKGFGDNKPTESANSPGIFYKRIWRPLVTSGSYHKAISQEKVTESFVSLRILFNKLNELFETIEPSKTNFRAYGHKVREILLLACMDVESSWAAVLKENNYSSGGQLTTKQYIKLLKPMLLDGYQMSLRQYPNFPSFTPFKGWNSHDPTKSLIWYDAYNKTKHDREHNFRLATLNNAITAVGAATVMFLAQFGFNFEPSWFCPNKDLIMNIFHVVTAGFKKYKKSFYIPKMELNNNSPQVSWDWNMVNFPF